MKKGSSFSVLIAIVMITISFTGCFGDDDDSEKSNKKRLFEMNFVIISNTSLPYEIYIPIPINGYANWVIENEGEPIDQINELRFIEGNGTYEIMIHEKEYFLRINSYNNAVINFNASYVSGNNMPDPFDELSSDKIYLNTSINTIITFDFHIRYLIEDSKDYQWNLKNHNVNNGWQDVEIKRELLIID